jgi:uncharacterized alpha-E superfamily protein
VKYYILLPKVEYVGMPIDTIQWAALLKSASALEMYRKRFNSITPKQVSRFLLVDREFPRAVLFCLAAADESLRAITGSASNTFSNTAEQRLGRLCADMTYAQVDEIINTGLHEYVDSLQTRLNEIHGGIYDTFFEVRSEEMAGSQNQTQS